MSRAQHLFLVLGCVVVLALEAPHAWSVAAADLGRVAEQEALAGARRPAAERQLVVAPLASLGPVLTLLRSGAVRAPLELADASAR